MTKTLVLAALAALLVAGAVAAALLLGGSSDGVERTAQSTATQAQPTGQASSTATPPSPTPRPAQTPVPDRTTCAEIRGTPYRSDAERAFYLTNCASQTQPQGASAPNIAVDTSASCGADIQITTNRSDKTFDVSGTTVEQIDASIEANGPVVEGQTASGLTEYEFGLDGSYCTRSGTCSIGPLSITADIVVTLPNLTTSSQIGPDLQSLWQRFAERIKVHENRHVTILEEGLAEIKRQLLTVTEQPNCDSLDHEIDKVWLLGSSQVEQRQRAFHAADSAGQGGSVVR